MGAKRKSPAQVTLFDVQLERADIKALPPGVRDIVNLIGYENTMDLLGNRGGQTIYISRHPNKMNWLINLIGFDNTVKLSAQYGPNTYTLPKLDKLALMSRNKQIIAMHDSGATQSDIASRFGLSTRSIHNIINRR